ncbi:MAG TPA: riboflavin kinase [Ktedonobacterales bacterium]|nr:riboflavin kinase [Ktedonobacterales bacterium]
MQVHYLLAQPNQPDQQGAPAQASQAINAVGRVVLAVSDFDGVHNEHRRLIAQTRQLARQLGAQPVALTFWPLPGIASDFDGPQVSAGRLLTTLDERLELLSALATAGDDPPLAAVYVAPFNAELARRLNSREALLAQVDRWFGQGCAQATLCSIADMSVDTSVDMSGLEYAPLASFVELHGDDASFLAPDAAESVSIAPATHARLRTLISDGRLTEATQQLGYPYRLHGVVGSGDQRGRLLGFPTANLRCDPRKMLPDNGVYAVRVRLPGERTFTHAGAANVGVRPMFVVEGQTPPRLVEIYLLDAAIDLYGLTIGVEFVARLRAEMRFSGEHALDDLVAQMARDIEQTRQALS